jgi:uncharacterized protein YqfA (UPF0365 family)
MNLNSPRNILLLIAIILTVLSAFLPVPLWISVLLVEIALFVP